jgi:hypothetical protein
MGPNDRHEADVFSGTKAADDLKKMFGRDHVQNGVHPQAIDYA